MSDQQRNGSEHPEAASPRPAVLGVRETKAHGADPQGREALILIESATGQEVHLQFTTESLTDFLLAGKGALFQMRQNASTSGEQLTAATPASKFQVGHMNGLDGTLMVIDPGLPSETTYLMPHTMACELGKLLLIEGGKRIRIEQAIANRPGAPKLATPSRRIYRPGEH